MAPEPVGSDSPPPSADRAARNSPIIWAAIVLVLCGAGLCWWFRVGNNLVTYFLMVVAVVLILLNVFGLCNPPA